MEALVLAGLIGFGYLYNSKEENVDVTVNKELNLSGGNNVYNQGYYDETQKLIKSLAETNFEASNNEHSKIINNQKIYDNLKSIPQTNEKVEGMSNYVYSSASGEEIRQSSFLNNDQGIGLTPFFSGAGANINLDDNRKLTTSQGGNDLYKSKTEVGAFKEPEKDIGNVFGNSFGEYMGDKGRYDSTNQMRTLVVMGVLGNTRSFFSAQKLIPDIPNFFTSDRIPDSAIADNTGAAYYMIGGSDVAHRALVDSQYK